MNHAILSVAIFAAFTHFNSAHADEFKQPAHPAHYIEIGTSVAGGGAGLARIGAELGENESVAFAGEVEARTIAGEQVGTGVGVTMFANLPRTFLDGAIVMEPIAKVGVTTQPYTRQMIGQGQVGMIGCINKCRSAFFDVRLGIEASWVPPVMISAGILF